MMEGQELSEQFRDNPEKENGGEDVEKENTSSTMDELLAFLEEDDSGLFDAPVKPRKITTEDRLERGFIEILEFFDAHRREPDPNTREISERKLGARLLGIRNDEKKLEALLHLDDVGLLAVPEAPSSLDELFAEDSELNDLLDVDGDETDIFDLSGLSKSAKTKAAAVSVAKRKRAADFEKFELLFKQKHKELADGVVGYAPYRAEVPLQEGQFFVLQGKLTFIAEVYPPEPDAARDKAGRLKHRVRILFDNGTESKMYAESFSSRMYEFDGKAVVNKDFQVEDFGDAAELSGSIYVLRSLSEDPQVTSISDLYKIGFTTTTVEHRIASAEKSATYLFAPVEVEATYRVYNLRPSAVEHLLHRVFDSVRIEIVARDHEGREAGVTEWFMVSLPVIDQAIRYIESGEIVNYHYDKAVGELVRN